MEFLSDIFIQYWKEVVVAVMLTATLPFIRRYVRKYRAKIINVLADKERLKKELLEEGNKRREAERKYQAESEEKRKAQTEAENMRAELQQERKAREESERKLQAETEAKLKAQKEAENLRGSPNPKVGKLMKTFSIFSRPKETEDTSGTQNNDELERLKSALERAERLRQNEAAQKDIALAEVKRLNKLLAEAKQELNAIEAAKPAPGSITAKLMELLKACEALPYPKYSEVREMALTNFLYIRNLFPPEGDVLRMKVVNAIVRYIHKFGYKDHFFMVNKDTPIVHKCMVLYALIIIAEGIAEKQISLDDSKKLTWKTAKGLIDTVSREHFNEHPEMSKPNDYDSRKARDMAGQAFGEFLPEIILEDKEFINALLTAAKNND